jgi:hypothetical protein
MFVGGAISPTLRPVMLFYLLFGPERPVSYTVYEPPEPSTDRIDRAVELRFVKDGFQVPAAVAAPFWLAAHKLWLALAGYVVVVALLLLADEWLELPVYLLPLLIVALHLVVGFEADTVERATLEGRGWTSAGTVTGTSANECERRFFERWLPEQPILSPRRVEAASANRDVTVPSALAVGERTAASRFAAMLRKR